MADVVNSNPQLDLILERTVDITPDRIWAAWTTPEHIKKWFTPAPWKTIECEIDLRPGGLFRTVMESPQGEKFPNEGCYLEVIPNQKLVWTSALGAGYRPRGVPVGMFLFSAAILLEPVEGGTKYTAIAIHSDESSRMKHDRMGFHDGWGKALDQLVSLMKSV